MDQGIQLLCRAEARRLLLLMGVTLVVVMVVQYWVFPSGIVLPSILFGGNTSTSTSISSNSNRLFSKNPSTFQMLDNNSFSINLTLNKTDEIDHSDSSLPSDEIAREKMRERDEGGLSSFGSVSNGIVSDDHREIGGESTLDGGGNSEKAIAPSPTPRPENGRSNADWTIASPALSPKDAVSAGPFSGNSKLVNETIFSNLSSSVSKDAAAPIPYKEDASSGLLQSNHAPFNGNSPSNSPKAKRKKSPKRPSRIVSISEMNDLLLQSRLSSQSMRPNWPSEVDLDLVSAKSEIEKAAHLSSDTALYDPIYRDALMFQRSYELMEKLLKVYIYPDGEKPIFHEPLLQGLYASEGWFMKHMEAHEKFITKDPEKAHLFYLPFSSRLLELTLYVPKSHSRKNLIEFMAKYADMLAAKYPFWNRTSGVDHFVAACHDWAPAETRGRLLNSIRALCNADVEVGFRIGKDVSLPETYVASAQNPLKNVEGNHPSMRPFLAFFAGNVHGYVRPVLLEYWENKDPDMKIFGPLPHTKGNTDYIKHMRSSKYCICPRGFEVNSPRVVEAIYYECVPVIISDNYIPPFFEVLQWESFAVFVPENDIPNLKNILMSISDEQYTKMHERVRSVQRHFLWHPEPVKYDLFHMILHSVWFNRVSQFSPASALG